MKNGKIIRTNGTITILEQEDFLLKDLQAIVGGNIERVKTHDGKDMIVNEDGFGELAMNEAAYELLHPKYKPPVGCTHNIFGNVFVFIKGRLS